jgi:hypothetical protein
MLAIAISLLFGLTALAAVMVIHAAFVHGVRRARQIMVELAALEAGTARVTRASRYREPAFPPLFAAA